MEPLIGIFWLYNGQLFYAESSPLEEGQKSTISIDYKGGHYTSWFIMGKNKILDVLPMSLRDEYDLIPRGRVIYHFPKEKFIVYHGDDWSEEVYKDIKKRYNLPDDQTIDDIDMHYNPLPDDFLF